MDGQFFDGRTGGFDQILTLREDGELEAGIYSWSTPPRDIHLDLAG